MTENIVSGKSIGSALSGAISSKLKAKATGVKEKFDPMNIAKFMTGGSRLAPAIIGRLTGRSQSDINYFAGDKNRRNTYTQIPLQMAAPDENLGGSAVEVLNKMFSFLQNSREEDKKRKDTAKQFMEEQKVEEQRRHNEFLKILKEYTSLGTTTLVSKREDKGGFLSGLMDTIKSMIAEAIAGVTALFNTALKAYEWIKDLKILSKLAPLATNLITFLGTTLGATLVTFTTPAALLLYLAKGEKEEIEKDPYNEKYKDNPYAMTLRGEAKTIAEATAINQSKAVRQFKRQDIVEFVKSNLSDVELINSPGAPGADRATLQKWLENNPKSSAIFQGSVAAISGKPGTEIPAGGRQTVESTQASVRKIDNALMSTAQGSEATSVPATATSISPAAQTATPLPADVAPSTAGGERGSLNPPMVDPTKPMVTPVPQTPMSTKPMVTPVPQTPMSNRMNDVVSENQNLNLNSYNMSMQSSSSPVVTTNTNSVDLPDKPIPATATVRDTTPILDYVLKQYAMPV